jgi:hypothetical protein
MAPQLLLTAEAKSDWYIDSGISSSFKQIGAKFEKHTSQASSKQAWPMYLQPPPLRPTSSLWPGHVWMWLLRPPDLSTSSLPLRVLAAVDERNVGNGAPDQDRGVSLIGKTFAEQDWSRRFPYAVIRK